MDATSSESKGRSHVDAFLHREERQIEELAADMGRDVVGRLDRILLREVLHERRRAEMDRMFGTEPERKSHDVLVQMRGPEVGAHPPARDVDERRMRVKKIRDTSKLIVSRLESSLGQNGIKLHDAFWIVPAAHTTVSTGELQKIASRNDVLTIVSNKPRLVLCLDNSRTLIGADQVQAMGINGTGITVAIIDTGVDSKHVALQPGIVTSQVDLSGEGTGDLVGHGTHCAGVVASQYPTFRGIAPGARIADIKIMSNPGTTTPAIAVSGVQAATTAGVQVASCSWGFSHGGGAWSDPPQAGQPDGTCTMCMAVDAAVSTGIVFAVAAGNENNDSCSSYDTHLRCPSLSRNAVTVAASDKSDAMAGFSSVGPTPDGRAKPDITATGVNIGSCRAAGTSMGTPIDANFTRASGTSMATPHVAGVAALMLSKTGTATPAMIKAAMMSTAVDLGAPTIQEGSGRINALAAVNAI
jgi:serine protease AprX